MKLLIVLCCILLVSGCNYSVEDAIENGDVVDVHGNITNLELLELFIENIENDVRDEVRVTRYTEEGDPIVIDLSYDSIQGIVMELDSSRDEFANGNSTRFNCGAIQVRYDGYDIDCKERGKIPLIPSINNRNS